MYELFIMFISLSVSASLIAALTFLLSKLFKKSLNHAWRYYIWLVVIVRLLMPYAPPTNLINLFIQEYRQPSTAGAVIQIEQGEQPAARFPQAETPIGNAEMTAGDMDNQSKPAPVRTGYMADYLWIIWITAAAITLLLKLSGYLQVIRFAALRRKKISNPDILEVYQTAARDLNIRRPPPLYTSKIAPAPMLIGIFRPFILIPDIHVDEHDLRYILFHELTHYKRLDGLYKWLVQVTVCIHWFNPLIYLMAKEIDKACELSCDEAVIRHMSRTERLSYGDMLLSSLQYSVRYPRRTMALPLNEDAELIKSRLSAIMDFKRISKGGIILALLLSVCIAVSAVFIGAYSDKNAVEDKPPEADNTNNSEALPPQTVEPDPQNSLVVMDFPDETEIVPRQEQIRQRAEMDSWFASLDKNIYNAYYFSFPNMLIQVTDADAFRQSPAMKEAEENGWVFTLEEVSYSQKQREEMEPWFEGLDRDVYSNHYYSSTDMVIQVTDIGAFKQSSAMKEAKENGWVFTLEEVRYSYNDLEAVLVKIWNWDLKEELQIWSIGHFHPQNTIQIDTTSLSPQNIRLIEEYAGMDLEFYNSEIANEVTGTGEYRMLGLDGVIDRYIPRLFDKPFVYNVLVNGPGLSIFSNGDGPDANFYLQYDNAMTNEQMSERIEEKIAELYGDREFYTNLVSYTIEPVPVEHVS